MRLLPGRGGGMGNSYMSMIKRGLFVGKVNQLSNKNIIRANVRMINVTALYNLAPCLGFNGVTILVYVLLRLCLKNRFLILNQLIHVKCITYMKHNDINKGKLVKLHTLLKFRVCPLITLPFVQRYH